MLIWASYYLLNYEKTQIHLKINSLVGIPIVDFFFKYITYLGDGIFAAIASLIVMFFNVKKGVFVLLSYIVSGLITSYLKNYCFDSNRPHFVFAHFYSDVVVKYVEGINLMALNSFPSGHATSAFAVFTSLALISSRQIYKVIFLFLAIIAAFSRTYLSQHWLVDITVGSIIGVLFSLLFYAIFMRETILPRLNKPLLHLF